MKKLSYLMAFLILAFSVNAFAKIQQNNVDNYKTLKANDYPVTIYHAPLQATQKDKSPHNQSLNYVTIDQYGSSIFNHLSKCTPIAWDPVSGAYFVVGMERIFNSHNLTKATMRISASMNGQQWDTTTVFDVDGWGGFYPSIAVTNYNNANKINQIPYTIFAQALLKSGDNWSFKGGLLVAGTLSSTEPYIDNPQGPENNNSSGEQMWSAMKLKSYILKPDAYVMGAGILSPSSDLYQYGSYGVFGWHPNDESVVVTNMPPQWTDSHFKASDGKKTSYQSSMEFDFDNDGLLYAAVDNLFADDLNNRLPGVSVSEDLGVSWTDFNELPASLITNYVSKTGFDKYYQVGSYEMNAFVVTGKNEFSYFMKLGLLNTGDSVFSEIDLVEAYYKNNAWGIRKITELKGTPQVLVYSSKFSTQSHAAFKIENDPIGNEIQVVKTLDRSKILLKWTDITLAYDINPPFNISTDIRDHDTTKEVQTQIKKTYTTDVFTCYRDVNSETWTKPVDNTQDTSFQKASWLPNIIPDVHHVPMIYHRTPILNPSYGIPVPLNRQIAYGINPLVEFTIFDADKGLSAVEDEPVASNNTLNNAYPNPADGVSEISFTIERASNVRLALYNSMGQMVKVMVNGYQPAGIHTYNLNVNGLASGTYYYTLTTGTTTLSKLLNVVK